MGSFNNKPTVMVVEDSDDTRFMLTEFLVLNGCQVVEADNGKEAVALIQHRCPDLILMDLHLPLLSGLDAAKQIRQNRHSDKDLPIVAITAYDGSGVQKSALRAGCNDYLTKPIDFDRLKKTLHQILDSH
jgi:CheY-like chemotaxis protein